MKNTETLKKQIIYRSTHRGSKEMDILLGNFVKKNINYLNDIDLKNLYELINFEDEILQNWYFSKKNSKKVSHNKVSKMFKEFKL